MLSKIAIAILSVIATAGCAAPGSALTRFRIQGSFQNHPDCPQAIETFQAILPDRYGLSGLDTAMGEPSQYGHEDQIDRVRIDEHGSFIHEFAPTTYSIVFFFLPPIGIRPTYPPPPFFAMRFAEEPHVIHVIDFDEGKLQHTPFDLSKKERVSAQACKLHLNITGRLERSNLVIDQDDPDYKIKGWVVHLQINHKP